jgi:cytochrome c peroxidase
VLPLFPVTSREEMRAFSGNELAAIPDSNFQGIWAGVMARLGQIPEYRTMFEQAYPGTSFDDMTFAHASNAIGGYIVQAFEMKASKWDQLLAGDNEALTLTQLKGAKNFLSAKCSICHSGANLSDGDFHNIALAQFGPGTGGGDDFGRFNVTGSAAQRYAFRSTPLRNVELSGPYGHAGQFESLLDFVDRYSESDIKLLDYDVSQVHPLLQSTLVDNFDDILDTRDPLLVGVVFDEQTIAEVAEFMNALTDQKALTLPAQVIPNSVPSGLSIDK